MLIDFEPKGDSTDVMRPAAQKDVVVEELLSEDSLIIRRNYIVAEFKRR